MNNTVSEFLKKIRFKFVFTIISFFITSADILLMPISNNITSLSTKWFDIVIGIIFWLSLIVGIVFFVMYAKNCKDWYSQNIGERDVYKERKIGLITFFSNEFAIFSDALLFISFAVFVLLMIFTNGSGFICYVVIAILIYSFVLHCILNGKSFYIHSCVNKFLY